MKETKAVFLGFGAVAFAIVGVPVALFLYGMHEMDKPPTNVEGPISQAFLGVHVGGNAPARPVPAIDDLLPVGMSEDAALRDLHRDGFDCSRKGRRTVCLRSLHHGSSGESWTVTLTLDEAGQIAARSGTVSVSSL